VIKTLSKTILDL